MDNEIINSLAAVLASTSTSTPFIKGDWLLWIVLGAIILLIAIFFIVMSMSEKIDDYTGLAQYKLGNKNIKENDRIDKEIDNAVEDNV